MVKIYGSKSRDLIRCIAVVIAAAALLAGCGSSGISNPVATVSDVSGVGGQANADQLNVFYNDAVSAGKTNLVIYNAKDYDSVYATFEKRYPKIKIQQVTDSGATLEARLQAEYGSGKVVGDIVNTGPPTSWTNVSNGWYDEFDAPGSDKILPAYQVSSHMAVVSALAPIGFEYNTSKVSSDDVPKSWSQLFAWKTTGDVATNDPTTSGTSNGAFAVLYGDKVLTSADLAAYAALKPKIEAKIAQASVDVASGAVSLSAPQQYDYYIADKAKGAPIAFQFPLAESNYFVPQYTGILKGGPDPDAAKLFVSWLLTPEGASALAAVGTYGSFTGATPPEGLPPLDQIKQAPPIPFSADGMSRYAELQTEVGDILKKNLQ